MLRLQGLVVTTEEELRQCLSVRKEVFVDEQQVPLDLELDEFDASTSACRHFLIRDGELPIAAARYRMYDERTAKLQRIAVRQPYRGKGIGKMMIDMMEDDICERGIASIMLDAQTHATRFYEKLGYATVSEEPFLDAGIWHVRMTKTITE